MSSNYRLVCRDLKKKVWIGQGNTGGMDSLYIDERPTMLALEKFLQDTYGHMLELVDSDYDETLDDYEEVECANN